MVKDKHENENTETEDSPVVARFLALMAKTIILSGALENAVESLKLTYFAEATQVKQIIQEMEAALAKSQSISVLPPEEPPS